MANGDGKKKRVSALDLLGDDKEKKEKKVSALDLLSVSEEGESAEPGKPQPAEEQASVSSTEPSPSSEKSEASDSVGEDSVPEGTIQTPNAAYSTEAIYLDKFSTPIYARSASDPRFTASNINVYYDPSEDTDIARARQELADQREPLNRRLFEAQQDENVGRGLAEAQDVSVELSRIDQAQRELERRESEMEDARTDAVFGGMFRYEQNGRPIKRSSMLNAIMDKEFLRDNRNSLKVIALTEKQPEDKEVKALLEHNLKHLDDSMFIDAGEGMVAQSMDIVRALIRSPFFIGEAVSREIGAEGAADTFKALQEVEHPMTYGWKKTAEELREKKFKQEDGIVEMLAKGDFAGAGREAFVSGMSSAPYLAMAAAGGNIGLGLIGLTTATQKREELGGLGVTDDKAATRGAIRVGVGEVVTERITLGILKGYFKGASGTLKNTIPKAIAAGAKRDVIKGYLSAFAKQAPKTLVDLPLKEMPSEIFASLNESAVANATGAENISPEEALKRAFDEAFAAVGLLGTAATINVVRSAATMARDLKAADSQMKQRFKDLSVAAEEIGGDIGEGMQKEADQILNDHVERLKELTPEELKEVTKLEKDISELKATEVDSPEAKRVVANKIKEKQARIDEVYELKEKEGPVEIEEYNALSPDEKLELQLRAIEQMENEMAEQGIKEYEADIEVILTNSIFSSSFTMVDERASQILQQDIDNLEGNLEGETRFSVAEEGESADAKSKIKFDAAKESQGMMPRFSLGDDVAAFIKDARGQGISEAAIRIVLNRRGVAQEDIVVAFEKAGPKANQKSKVAEVDIPQAPELTPQKEVIEQKKEEEPTQKPKEGAKETDELREQGEAEQTQEPSVGDMREVDGAETTQTQEAQVDIPQAQIESASKERVFKEIDGIVEKTKARKSKKSDPKVLDKLAYDNALQYLQESKWYEEANDIERESAVRELRKMVNQKEKSAPFPKRIFQEKREEKTVTMTDKQALKKQIKDFARGVREGRKDLNSVKKQVKDYATTLIKDVKKQGVKYFPSAKINSIIRVIDSAKTPHSLSVGLNKIEQVIDDIAINDEEVKRKSEIKKFKKQAITNLKKKLGHIRSDVETILGVDVIPAELKDEYYSVMSNIGSRESVIVPDVKAVQSLANKLREQLDVQIPSETTAKEQKEEDINDTVGVISLLKRLIDSEKIKFNSERKQRAALEFARLSKEYLSMLSPNELKNIRKEANNLFNGHMTNGFIEAHNIKQKSLVLAKRLHKSDSLLRGSKKLNKLEAEGEDISKKARRASDKVISKVRRRALNHIDEYYGAVKNTEIYNNIINVISRAISRRDKITKNIFRGFNKLRKAAEQSRVKGLVTPKKEIAAQKRLNYLTDLYFQQRQHELNPDSKKQPSAEDIVAKIEEDYKDGGVEYSASDMEAIRGVMDEAKNSDGSVTSESLLAIMNPKEKALVDYMSSVYESMYDKFIYLTEQLRGETVESVSGYAPRSVVGQEEITSEERLSNLKSGQSKYARSSSTKERVSTAPLLKLGGLSNFRNHVTEVGNDYEMSRAVREVDGALKMLKDMSSSSQKPFVSALTALMDNHIVSNYRKEVMDNSPSSRIFREIVRGVYTNMLINIKRIFYELPSNIISYIGAEGKNRWRKATNRKFRDSVRDMNKSVMDFVGNEYGFVHQSREGSSTLDLRALESSPFPSGYSTGEKSLGDWFADKLSDNYVKNLGKMANNIYYNKVVDFMLIDAWKMELAQEYKKKYGQFPNVKRMMNDPAYREDTRSKMEWAIGRADKHISDMFNTASTFERALPVKERSTAKAMIFDFMQSFPRNENATMWSGLKSALGKGAMDADEGAVKLASAVARMVYYTGVSSIVSGFMYGLYSDDDDPMDIVSDALKRGGADVGMIFAFGQLPSFVKAGIAVALKLTQEQIEKALGEKILSSGDDLFFGGEMTSSKDAFRTLGGVGYLANATILAWEATKKGIKAKQDGKDFTEAFMEARGYLALQRLIAAALGLPMVKDVELMQRMLDDKFGRKDKKPVYTGSK